MAIIVAMWLILALWGVRYTKSADDTAFDRGNSLALRGICSIEIMMGHLGIATDTIILYPNRKAGILFVGIFFALSGYGLTYSLHNKVDYLKHFLLSRLTKLLIPAYVIYAIGIFAKTALLGNEYNLTDIFNPYKFFTDTNWYVWEMLFMYIAFYICVKLMDLNKAHYILLALSTIFVCLAYALDLERPWYGSTFCFWLGIFYFLHMEKIKTVFVLKRWILKIIGLGLLMVFGMGLFFIKEDWMLGDLFGRNLASVSFVMIVIILLHRFKLGNAVSLKLGKCSYEIFLFHQLFISLLRPYIANDVIYAIAVIVITVAVSMFYVMCSEFVEKRENNKNEVR